MARRDPTTGSTFIEHKDRNGNERMGHFAPVGAFGEQRGVGASKGVALSTTAAFTPIPDTSNGIVHLSMLLRNLTTAVVGRYALNPYLIVLKTTDALVADANATDYSANAQDGNDATDVTLSSLDTAANNDYLFVGSHLPFRGVVCDVDAANANASVLTVKYWDGDSWADISASDGTASGGATMAVDGNVTWTVPTDWAVVALTAGMSGVDTDIPYVHRRLYWTRWEFSAALDSSTTLNGMLAMNRSTAYAEMIAERLDQVVYKGQRVLADGGYDGYGCIEALTDAGTGNLLITAACELGAKFS